jgi:hypothetical protein
MRGGYMGCYSQMPGRRVAGFAEVDQVLQARMSSLLLYDKRYERRKKP